MRFKDLGDSHHYFEAMLFTSLPLIHSPSWGTMWAHHLYEADGQYSSGFATRRLPGQSCHAGFPLKHGHPPT